MEPIRNDRYESNQKLTRKIVYNCTLNYSTIVSIFELF